MQIQQLQSRTVERNMRLNQRANYQVVSQDEKQVTLQDIGPWSTYLTITNAAERVVAELLPSLEGRRLFYYDSEGDLAELVIKNGEFVGFDVVSKI